MPSPSTYTPHPRDFVTIRETYAAGAVAYKVPAGKVFVLTGLGATGFEFGVSAGQPFIPVVLSAIFFPGMAQYDLFGDNGYDVRAGVAGPPVSTVTSGSALKHNFCTIAAVPPGCAYPAGTQLEVFGDQSPSPSADTDARAYGYLAPAN